MEPQGTGLSTAIRFMGPRRLRLRRFVARYRRIVAKEKKRSPDDLLVPEQFPELNEAFYATKPWEYFNYRNHLLMLAAGAGDRLVEVAEDGVTYKGMTYQEKPGGEDEDGDQAKVAKENFVISDSEALLHHASETLLRLYLAHEGLKPCPWLELARVRTPGQLKQMLEDRFLEDLSAADRRARVAPVFFGGTDRSKLRPDPPEEDWNKGLDNIESFLGHFARHFLDADVYNALKHGLAVRPGDAATRVDDGALLKADGPAIEYLSLRNGADGHRRWHRSTSWIQPDHSMALIYLASRLMDSIWRIARLRYLNEHPDGLDLWTTPAYGEVMQGLADGEGARIIVQKMHVELDYYVDPADEQEMPGKDD